MATFNEISFSKIKAQVENYLKQEYAKADLLYSNASPYGQILAVLENLQQLSNLYLKNAIKGFDLSGNNQFNERIVRNAAIFAGHNPGRAISATGTLKLTVKSSAEIDRDVPGGKMTIANRNGLKNKTNGLEYAVNIGIERQTYKVTSNTQIFIPIIQGKWETRTNTGTGQINQTYQISLRGNIKDIENFNYEVTVNGEYWETKKHIYELLPDEKACVVRTGFEGGIDVIFGNGGFGRVPELGAVIQVNYLVSDGARGSIFRRTPNDWTFIDPAIDGFGSSIDISKVFDVAIYTDINFGADKETIEFTRNILPISSNNFVLGLPQQYAYQIKKLGIFSHVNAYETNGVIYIVATPNINLFKNQNADYFSVDIGAFELDNYEKAKIDRYLRINGNIMLTRRYQIDSPKLSYYVINIFIITYSDAIDDNVYANIYDKISEYFLNFNRLDRVPKVDLIKKIAEITDIHSVDLSFVSKKNEDYHRAARIENLNRRNQFASAEELTLVRPNPTYNPKEVRGIDPILGDIIFEPSEIPVIRGGWIDRNGVFFSDNIAESGLKSVNIIKKGTVDVKNKPQM